MSIKLVACDLDKTLLDENGQLPADFDTYMKKLKKANVLFVAASGRPSYTVAKMFDRWLDQIYIISDNGAAISYKGNLIYKSLMPMDDIQKMISLTLNSGEGVPLICSIKKGVIPEFGKKYDDTFRIFFPILEYTNHIEDFNEDSNKFTVLYPNEDALKWWNELFEPAFGDKYSITLGGDIWVDVMNKGINKGSAMERLSEILDISLDDMMAFGDHYNDYEMLKTVGHPYIMENAPDELRTQFENVAPPHYENGVFRTIDKVLNL